ncbi:MAG: ubiquinone/menaquinone biosynthesis C-methylase UbiE [Bacteroidia bacterium]|jgi:ubiquinone/menaquinone biosynthesis C-methylase UbiE
MSEQNAYILGTDPDELFRLGVQHQVWASEAQKGWEIGGFGAGQTLLDLGCGPGFCTKELAFITGKSGNVIGVDRSEDYIKFLKNISEVYGLNVKAIASDFNDLELQDNSIDGAYCRWALAWVSNPKEVVTKVYQALKPGGRFVIHEYFDWMTHQTVPNYPNLSKCIRACFDSFENAEGSINVGRSLSRIANDIGFKVVSTRPMLKMARPNDLTWQWPITFYHTYFDKLVGLGYLSETVVKDGLNELKKLEQQEEALICCPSMVELVIEK